jgi:hypothetical protein
MVPAAPLLPTTVPDSAEVAHREGPGFAVVVGPLVDEDPADSPEGAVVDGAAEVVDGAEDPDEQALSTDPVTTAAATRHPERPHLRMALR